MWHVTCHISEWPSTLHLYWHQPSPLTSSHTTPPSLSPPSHSFLHHPPSITLPQCLHHPPTITLSPSHPHPLTLTLSPSPSHPLTHPPLPPLAPLLLSLHKHCETTVGMSPWPPEKMLSNDAHIISRSHDPNMVKQVWELTPTCQKRYPNLLPLFGIWLSYQIRQLCLFLSCAKIPMS